MKTATRNASKFFALILIGVLIGYLTFILMSKTGAVEYLWEQAAPSHAKKIEFSGKCFELKKGWVVHEKNNKPQEILLGLIQQPNTQNFAEHLNPILLKSIEKNLSLQKKEKGYSIKYFKDINIYYLIMSNGELLFSYSDPVLLEKIATDGVIKKVECG